MNVNEELLAVDELAELVAFSPRRVIEGTWTVVERAVGKAFPSLARSEEHRVVEGNALLSAVEATKEFTPEILEALRVIYGDKENISNRVLSGEEEEEEKELPQIAERCIESSRRVLEFLSGYKPKRRYKAATARPEPSGIRKAVALGGSSYVMIGGLLVAGVLWLSSFLLDGREESTRIGSPAQAAVQAKPEQKRRDLLGFWQRSDGVIMRIVPHLEHKDRYVGFIVKAPTDVPGPPLQVGESVLVVDAGEGGHYKGYQKMAGQENKWKSIEFVVRNQRIEADGGTFERLGGEERDAAR